jgi:glycosyltransferase involved in cell wall biosynthesis
MRIAFLSRIVLEHGVRGGMEQHGATLCAGLAARGHTLLTITTAHPDGLPAAHGPAGDTCFVDAPAGRYSHAWWAESWAALRAEHARTPFDIVISQSAGAQANIGRARRVLALPTVVILHGTLGSDWRTRWRDIRSARGIYRMARYLSALPGQAWRWRTVRDDVAAWIAVSGEVASDWRREMGVAADRISVIANGVDLARFAPDPAARAATRAALSIPADEPLLIAVGRIEENKGFQIAVRALARLEDRRPNAHLAIVGEGGYRAQLEREITDRGLGARVHTLGYRPNADLPALLAAADLFLMPSLCHEAFPLTIVEAMGGGLPVLATNVGGVPSAVDAGRTGLLLPMGDVAAWAAALDTMLGDPRRRQAMGALARQVAVARFSRERMVEATERVLVAAVQAGVKVV